VGKKKRPTTIKEGKKEEIIPSGRGRRKKTSTVRERKKKKKLEGIRHKKEGKKGKNGSPKIWGGGKGDVCLSLILSLRGKVRQFLKSPKGGI